MRVAALASGVTLAALSASSGTWLGTAVAAGGSSSAVRTADDFTLADQDFLSHQLHRMTDATAVVLVTYVPGSQAVRRDAAALRALQGASKGRGVEVFLLDSNPAETREAVRADLVAAGLAAPVLFDKQQLVAEQLGVIRTAEAIVIDPKTWRIAYRGPISRDGENSAAAAVEAVAAGRPVTAVWGQSGGEPIRIAARGQRAQFERISYAADVAPIIQDKCADCHQAGGIGPMALTSYKQVKGFSPMIREVVRTKRMPPYGADPDIGHFKDDKRLSSDQIRTLVHWIEAGSPRGAGADPLQKAAFSVPEWPLGKPDLIVEAPAYDIPASGVVDYQRPYVPNPMTEGRWLKASTIKVANRQAVHHVLSGQISPEDAPGKGAPQKVSESAWGSSIGTYAVGSESEIAPKGYGTWLKPGGGFGLQNHYTPFGKAVTEKSQIALYFYKPGEAPKHVMHNTAIANPTIMIAPNTEFHRELAYVEFPKDAVLFGAFPHAHYRGGSSTFAIRYPDGREKMLLALPRYDFNWQREYTFAEPIKVPAGSKLIARFTFNNTKRNPANPDPNRTVPWGEQSFDEMLYTQIRYAWADETSDKLKPEYETALSENRVIGIFDRNIDGKVTQTELAAGGGMGAMMKANFAKLDRNADGALDTAELRVASAMMNRRRPAESTAHAGRAPAAPGTKPTALAAKSD